ncbi:MAG TPA: pitrilysin family protein [Terriglobales bacterium]|jgi:zinc protease
MKTARLSLAAIFTSVVILASLSPSAIAQAKNWKQINIPKLPAFHPQEPKRIELPNGMVIFLQEDHELPLMDGTMRIRGGDRSEPASKTGMLDIYGDVWRTGGTKTQTGDQLDDYLEARAAKVETEDTADSTIISFSCLKGDFDDVFKAFNDVLRNPEFRADKIDIAKKQMDDGISRRNDDPSDIAARLEPKLAYGADNPYARNAEYATVAAVTRQDLIDWHKAHVHPNNIILGIVGDFDSAALEAKLRALYGSWQKGPAVTAPDITFHSAKPGYYLAKKTDVNQSSVAMLGVGIRRDNPDFYAVEVFDEAFGGGFSSRLFKDIRTLKGLAYGVGGGIGTSFDHPGMLRISTATKSESTIETISAIYEEIDKLKTDPISDSEIKLAKDSILNSFVFNYDTPEKVLRERMAYEFYGYPADFLERFRTGIEGVTKEDVARVIPKYLHKDQLAVLVVGNPEGFAKPLSTLGPVTDEDLTIPPMPGEEQGDSGPTASNPEGKALMAKVVEALGGASKLKAVKSVAENLTLTQKSPQGSNAQMTMHTTLLFPGRMHVAMQGPMGNVTYVVTPSGAFVVMQDQQHEIPGPQAAEMLKQIKRNLIYLGQHADDPAFTFAASGTEKIGDVDATILDINGPDISVHLYVDPQSGRVLREKYQGMGPTGPETQETDLSNWKTSDGITLPYLRSNKQNGEVTSTSEIQSLELNPTIDPKLFEKPAAEAGAAH